MNIEKLSKDDSEFIGYLRSLAIVVIVFGHVGGFWVFAPYSEVLLVFNAIFFFLSGGVSYFSFIRSEDIISYQMKRIINLLVPYYFLCVLSLCVFVYINRQFPDYNTENFFAWLQIIPSQRIMAFPVGQIWFLHALLLITLVAPGFFIMNQRFKPGLFVLVSIFVLISGVQVVHDISGALVGLKHDFYTPFVYCSFFVGGILYYSTPQLKINIFLIILLTGALMLSVGLVKIFHLAPSYAKHGFPPNLFFVAGSVFVITLFLLLHKYFLQIIRKWEFVVQVFSFIHYHTFSIFLLHTFAIYFVEILFRLNDPNRGNIVGYAVTKLFMVFTMTCVMAPPFTFLSNFFISQIQHFFNLARTSRLEGKA